MDPPPPARIFCSHVEGGGGGCKFGQVGGGGEFACSGRACWGNEDNDPVHKRGSRNSPDTDDHPTSPSPHEREKNRKKIHFIWDVGPKFLGANSGRRRREGGGGGIKMGIPIPNVLKPLVSCPYFLYIFKIHQWHCFIIVYCSWHHFISCAHGVVFFPSSSNTGDGDSFWPHTPLPGERAVGHDPVQPRDDVAHHPRANPTPPANPSCPVRFATVSFSKGTKEMQEILFGQKLRMSLGFQKLEFFFWKIGKCFNYISLYQKKEEMGNTNSKFTRNN